MDNPQAFPGTFIGSGGGRYPTPGMTLLDWFAGQALKGLCEPSDVNADPVEFVKLSAQAYQIALAMLAARDLIA